MAVSVRLDPLMEKELELSAKRQGVTKSQFIITALERALGRKDPYKLLMEITAETAGQEEREPTPDENLSPFKAATRAKVKAKYETQQAEWLAYQEAKKAAMNKGETHPPAVHGATA